MDARRILARSFRWNVLAKSWKTIAGCLIPLLLMPMALSESTEARCGYVLAIMASYWVLEPIHLAATAMLPIALFPLLGILSTEEACLPYMKSANALFLGGLLLAISIENCNLHRRIAFKVLLIVGTSVKRILFGLMVTTMFLSMWISNTATTAMMIPIVDAMVRELEMNRKESGEIDKGKSTLYVEFKLLLNSTEEALKENKIEMDSRRQICEPELKSDSQADKKFATLRKALLLSIAYSANIGGTGTITGTGTNLVLQSLMDDKYPGSEEITFGKWFVYAFPGALVCVLVAYGFLLIAYIRNRFNDSNSSALRRVLKTKYEELGSMTFQELVVLVLFITLVLLWLFREPGFIRGWSSFLPKKVSDGTPAILIGVLMFLIPANISQFRDGTQHKTKTVLEWSVVHKKMPWGVILLLGGGFSLAKATEKSKLSAWLGDQLSSVNISQSQVLMILLTVIAAFLTEIASNVATASVLLPIVNSAAINLRINPLLFLVPITIAVSFAFMFPVATPPNALVFEYLNLKPIDMIKPGIVMNVVCITIALLLINSWGIYIFNLSTFPDWAQKYINITTGNITSTTIPN